MKRIFKILILPGIIVPQFIFNLCSAQIQLGEILTDDIAAGADIAVLQAEANSFNTIKKGVALSLAMCEGIDLCSPNVNRAELEQIISTLDARIGSLGQRYEQSGNKELESVLLAYSDAKDSYTQYLEKLGTIVVEEPEPAGDLFGESDFFGGFGGPAAIDPRYNIFNDANEELLDDLVDEEVDDDAATEAAGTATEEENIE